MLDVGVMAYNFDDLMNQFPTFKNERRPIDEFNDMMFPIDSCLRNCIID